MRKLWLVVRVMLKGEKLATSGFNLSTTRRRRGLLSRLGIGDRSAGTAASGISRKILMVVLFLMSAGIFVFYGYRVGGLLLQVEPFIILITRAIALFIALFSVFNVVTLLYYSEELPFYLSLPLSKGTLVGAKLIHATIYNIFMILLMIVWPLFIGLGVKMNLPWTYYPSAFWLSFLVAMSAQAIISIILVIVMRFTKFAKNKDRFTMVFSVIMIAFVIGVSMAPALMSGSLEDMSFEDEKKAVSEMMQMGQESRAISLTSAFFAPPLLLIGKMSNWNNGVLSLTPQLLGTLITLALSALLFVVARRFYVDGAMAVQGSDGKKRGRLSTAQVEKGLRKRSPFLAFMKKDWLILRRTPAYFTNYLLPIFIVPVIMLLSFVIPLFMAKDGIAFDQIKEFIEPIGTYWKDPTIGPEITRWAYLIMMGVMAFLMSMNSLSLSMISREGKSAYLMKMAPQTYLTQIRSKLFLGSLLGFLSTFIFFLAPVIIAQAPWYILLTFCLIYFSETYLSQVVDGLLDIFFPRLDWSQDIEIAKRQGLTFASFFLSFVLLAAKAASFYFFSEHVTRDPIILTIFVVAVYLVLHFVAELLLRTYAQRKLDEMVI